MEKIPEFDGEILWTLKFPPVEVFTLGPRYPEKVTPKHDIVAFGSPKKKNEREQTCEQLPQEE